MTRALEFAADKLFDTGLGKRQFLKEVLVMIIGGENEITERVRHIVGYLKMRGNLHLSFLRKFYGVVGYEILDRFKVGAFLVISNICSKG